MIRIQAQSGFSLVEALVAITILLFVIVGPMTIMSTTANSTSFASDQVTGFFLAQEGLGIAQKARDDIALAESTALGNGWDVFTDPVGDYEDCFDTAGCSLEISNDAAAPVLPPSDCGDNDRPCRIFFNDGNVRSRFTHDDSFPETGYSRSIWFDYDIARPDELRVVSTVTWTSGLLSAEQSVSIENYLYNIYDTD